MLATGLASGASAATHEAHGWWWRAQTGLLNADVPPPAVPEDGLAIETTPDGPSAISAVRYTLEEGETRPVLVLTVASQQGDLAIQACVADRYWTPANGGPWGERPTADCSVGVDGQPSDDGTTWRWEVGALVEERGLDLVLVPAPGVGRVTFEAPDDASLETQRGGAGSQGFDPPPVSEFAPPASSGASSSTGSSGTYAPPAFTGGGPSTASGPVRTGRAQPPAVAPPVTAGPGQPAPQAAPPAALGTPAPAVALPTTSPNSTAVGAILAAAAVLIGFALWREEAPAARRLGRFATAPTAADAADSRDELGGLGRFARPRAGTPQQLL